MRKGGILLPVSSIPSKYGIGTFSKQAYEFVDFLERAGQSFWQILPLGPTGYGDSPYQSFSTFAGNPYYIDLEELIKKGWLTREECDACDFGSDDGYVDYEKIYLSRFRILKTAYERSHIKEDKEFGEFKEENAAWLEDYALYMAVKNSFQGASWIEWDEEIRLRKPEAMKAYKEKIPVMIIGGCAGSFLGEYQAGGVIIVLGLHKDGRRIVGNFPCTGMHGGKMFLRGRCEDIHFPKQVTAKCAAADELEEIREYLS